MSSTLRTILRQGAAGATALALIATPALASAQEALGTTPPSAAALSFGPNPLITAVGLALLGLVPFVLVITTSFAKIAVVLSILRSALGTQNVPPNVVLASLALILSAYVMTPVAAETLEVIEPWLDQTAQETELAVWTTRATQASEPLRAFLQHNSGGAEMALFAELRGVDLETTPDAPLSVVIPAFAITELAEAFQIGFLLFLPFLVLDLFVGSVLLSLGMHMLSPTTVSMPFKLLLFVLVGGWMALSQSLVLGYTYAGGGG